MEKSDKERGYEIGKDESWFANVKRTYDEYQQVSLDHIRQNDAYIQKVISDAQADTVEKRNIANQSLQNAVETANMVGKQAVRHGDLAIDRQWNVDEVAHLVSKTSVFLDAISAAVAAAVANALNKS